MPKKISYKTVSRFGIILPPEIEREENLPPLESCLDAVRAYPFENDSKGNPARVMESVVRFYLCGKWERTHPAGVADCVIKKGVTLEIKTGHGNLIEPCFHSLEELLLYLDVRTNPLLHASHIAYLPRRAPFVTADADGIRTAKETLEDFLVFSAIHLFDVLGTFGKLKVIKNGDLYGIGIVPWIADGYAQKNSPKTDAFIRNILQQDGLTLREFARKMGTNIYPFR